MRPIAIVTAVVLLGVFTSTTASQTNSLPQAPEPPRRLPTSGLANSPNILRQAESSRGNTAPRPAAYRRAESRQLESWHQPATTTDKPAPVKIVTGFPQAQPGREAQPGDLTSHLSIGSQTAPSAVMPTNYEAPPKKLTPPNKLTPPRRSRTADMKLGENHKQKKQDQTSETPGGMSSLITIVGSLAVVIGLFLIVAFLMRRATPTANSPLPDEVVEVLGRAPLANRQQVHLLRCGTKLLLVCVTPNGTETLTEITDPAEVDRVAALCRRSSSGSATSNFRQVFEQLSWDNRAAEPTGGR